MEHIFWTRDPAQAWRNGQWCRIVQDFGGGELLLTFRNGDAMEATIQEIF